MTGDWRKRLEGLSEDRRYEAWLALYRSRDGEGAGEIDRILSGRDSDLKILLARFLAGVGEEGAVSLLARLIRDGNPIVSEAAARAFEKNQYKEKFRSLLPLAVSGPLKVRIYAIGWLSQNRVNEAGTPLIRALEGLGGAESPEAAELLHALLTAFRFLPDRRFADAARAYLGDARQPVRFKAVLALGSLFEAGEGAVRKDLVSLLGDGSPQIRKAVLWSLKRRPSLRNLPLLLERSKSDPDPDVRQEAIDGLARFPRSRVARHLLGIVAGEADRYVALKAESVLLGFPCRKLIRGLKRALDGEDPKARVKAMTLLADLQSGSKKYLQYLLAGLKRQGSDKEKIPYLDALGALRDLDSISALERLALDRSPVVSYAAMGAMLKIWKAHSHFPVLKYLTDPAFPALSKQMILKTLVPRAPHWKWDERLIAALKEMAGDANLNIRYLAVQCLVPAVREDLVGLLVRLALREEDPSFLRSVRHHLNDLLLEKPEAVFKALSEHRQSPEAVLFLLGLLDDARLAGERAESAAGFLAELALSCHDEEILGAVAGLLAGWVRRGGLSAACLFSLLDRAKEKGRLLAALAKRIQNYSPFPMGLPAATVGAWLRERDPTLTHALIDWLSADSSRQSVITLVSLLCDPEQGAYHYQASGALKRLMHGEAAP